MRPAVTLLLVLPDRTIRADCSSGAQPALLHLTSCPSGEDLPSSVETALWTGGPVGRKVWILSTEVWTQTLRVPVRAIADLSPAQLRESLAIEAEPVSGIDASQSALACEALHVENGDQRYWVSQIPLFHLDRMVQAVRQRRGRLMGVLHPAGVTAIAEPTPAVELWPGVILGHCGADVELLTLDPQVSDWRTALQEWTLRHDVASGRRLAASSNLTGVSPDDASWRTLDTDEQLGPWLTEAAATLARPPRCPVVRIQPKPMSPQRLNVLTAAACGVVLVLCLAHFLWLDFAERQAQARVGGSKQQQEQLTQTQRRIEQARKEVERLEEQVANLSQTHDRMQITRAAHQRRWAQLLTLLAQHTPENLVVQRIDSGKGDVTLAGICLEADLANELAANLAEQVAPLGWRVLPPEKKAMGHLSTQGPWAYELVLRDAPAPTASPNRTLASQEPGR